MVPSLIPIYQFDFLCVFYFIIAYFFIALFTVQLKRKDGSVGSPPIEGTRLADQSLKHPFAQLNSLSLNIYFNSHRFHAHFPLSFSGTRPSQMRVSRTKWYLTSSWTTQTDRESTSDALKQVNRSSIGQPTAAGKAVEKWLTNERCAVPRHAESRRGRSAAGAAAGAP